MTYAVKYLAGAYRAAGGNESRAVSLYASGYYYARPSARADAARRVRAAAHAGRRDLQRVQRSRRRRSSASATAAAPRRSNVAWVNPFAGAVYAVSRRARLRYSPRITTTRQLSAGGALTSPAERPTLAMFRGVPLSG